MDKAEEYWITAWGVTSLDGTWARSHFPPPRVRNWGLSEANVLHWSTYDIVRTFRRPAVIRRPHIDSAPGELCPLPPSLRPWLLRAATPLNKPWYTALTRGIRGPWALGGAKFSIPKFCITLRKTNRKVLQGDDSAQATCPNISGSFSWIF